MEGPQYTAETAFSGGRAGEEGSVSRSSGHTNPGSNFGAHSPVWVGNTRSAACIKVGTLRNERVCLSCCDSVRQGAKYQQRFPSRLRGQPTLQPWLQGPARTVRCRQQSPRVRSRPGSLDEGAAGQLPNAHAPCGHASRDLPSSCSRGPSYSRFQLSLIQRESVSSSI